MVEISISGLCIDRAYVSHESIQFDLNKKLHLLNFHENGNLSTSEVTRPRYFLKDKEEFRIIVICKDISHAYNIYHQQLESGVLVGNRFCFDTDNNWLRLLAPGFDVVRLGDYTQSNIFRL